MPLIMGQPENEQAYHRYELGAIDQILLSRSEANQALRLLSSLPVPEEALRLADDLVHEGPYRRFLAALFERYTRTPSFGQPQIICIDLVEQVMSEAGCEFRQVFGAWRKGLPTPTRPGSV